MSEITRHATVTLREINRDNLRAILSLHVAEKQRHLVAPNAMSLAEAYFDGEHAWFQAIYADETPVGFLMMFDDPRQPTYYLWRYMIDENYQGMGFGYQAMQLLISHVKTRPNAAKIVLSYVPEEGNPSPFYRKSGFYDTGEVHDGENVMHLDLVYDEDESPLPAIGKALTHVVLFKLNDTSAAVMTKTVDVLRGLEGNVPTLRHIEVGTNIVASNRAYDLALITRFDDLAAMEAYQGHPYHQNVLTYMKTVIETAVAVDYES